MKRTEVQRMSLPSHFRQKERRPLTATSFVPPSFRLNRALSQSSGTLTPGSDRLADWPIKNIHALLHHNCPASQVTANTGAATPTHLISTGDLPSGQSHTTPEPPPQSAAIIEGRHTMKEHRPINYNQAPPTRENVTTSTETVLHQSPVHEARAQVQHLAIASSDIVGWTSDGRLIVQMPANQGMPEVGVATVNPTPTRRASTGKS